MISISQLKSAMPYATDANLKKFIDPLNRAMERFQINTPLRIAAFLAQVCHESGSLKYTKELATGEAYDVGKLAVDLGNTQEDDGDGERTKGRGLIQITGTSNYIAVGKFFGQDFIKNPELLEGPEFAAMSAGWFWSIKSLNVFADKPDMKGHLFRKKEYTGFEYLGIRINGGLNGQKERSENYVRAKKALGI